MLISRHKELQYCLFSYKNLLKREGREGREGGGGRGNNLLLGFGTMK